ncbi:MAG: hypothetical protein WCC97_12135 [Candidatus Acidiferrales bacterium]
MSGYNTNLAAEFHVLSVLHRLGAEACLTLGNKKGVDIFLIRDTGASVMVEVKGVAGKFDWPADNILPQEGRLHFIVLVSYEGRIHDPSTAPSVWVVPGEAIGKFIKQYEGRRVVSRAKLLKEGIVLKDGWQTLLK